MKMHSTGQPPKTSRRQSRLLRERVHRPWSVCATAAEVFHRRSPLTHLFGQLFGQKQRLHFSCNLPSVPIFYFIFVSVYAGLWQVWVAYFGYRLSFLIRSDNQFLVLVEGWREIACHQIGVQWGGTYE